MIIAIEFLNGAAVNVSLKECTGRPSELKSALTITTEAEEIARWKKKEGELCMYRKSEKYYFPPINCCS